MGNSLFNNGRYIPVSENTLERLVVSVAVQFPRVQNERWLGFRLQDFLAVKDLEDPQGNDTAHFQWISLWQ
jgi:hypothetical protein